MMQLRRYLMIAVVWPLAAAGLVSCADTRVPDASQRMTLKPSVTYLHLLRYTPFFTALSTEQLRWVIDHSREWEADAGAVIVTCDEAKAAGASNADFWILLDGGWKLQHDGLSFASGHADPGKWFSTAMADGASCSLATTGHSYVMRISGAQMRLMSEKSFAFGPHLDGGRAYYRAIFHGHPSDAQTSAAH